MENGCVRRPHAVSIRECNRIHFNRMILTMKIAIIKKKKIYILATIVIIIFLGCIIYLKTLINKKSHLVNQLSPPPPIPKEITKLVDTVSKKESVPKDEIPTVATVTNVSELEDQVFFRKARNGDK